MSMGESTVEQILTVATALLGSVRRALPEELDDQLKETVKELLETLRSLIDRILQQLESQSAEQFEVEDIPIA